MGKPRSTPTLQERNNGGFNIGLSINGKGFVGAHYSSNGIGQKSGYDFLFKPSEKNLMVAMFVLTARFTPLLLPIVWRAVVVPLVK